MPDRLRDLLDLVVGSLDDTTADGRELARRAHFSRDHLDRLLVSATGETAVRLRRRLLLERAAWQLRHGATATEAARDAGYGSLAAFSRAFARAFGAPPTAYDGKPALAAPNGVRFHPPGGLLLPAEPADAPATVVGDVRRHLDHARELVAQTQALARERREEPRRPGFVVTPWEGEEPSAASMAANLVRTHEVWVAAIDGELLDGPGTGTLLERHDRSAPRFARIARRVRDGRAWEEGFVDALCEPPQSFTYGAVLEHVLERGAVRRAMLAEVLAELR